MKYLIMENHLSYSVALDEDGRFLQVANMGYSQGQTVEQVFAMERTEKKRVSWRALGTVAAAAACFLIAFGAYFNAWLVPVASVYLSINPEVCIDVSRKDTVVELKGVNEDGAVLIDGYSYKRKDIATVTDDLVDRAIEMGYLSEGGMVVIDLDSPDEAWFQKTGVALRQNLNEHLSERLSVTIEIHRHSADGQAGGEEPGGETVEIPTAGSNEPADGQEEVTAPAPGDSGLTDYGTQPQTPTPPPAPPVENKDTDYGPNSDGVTDYGDTDYGPNNDGVTDYSDTDYGPNSDGVTDYNNSNYEEPAGDPPDDNNSNYGDNSDDGDDSPPDDNDDNDPSGDDDGNGDSNYSASDYE